MFLWYIQVVPIKYPQTGLGLYERVYLIGGTWNLLFWTQVTSTYQ